LPASSGISDTLDCNRIVTFHLLSIVIMQDYDTAPIYLTHMSARRNYGRFIKRYYDKFSTPIWPPDMPVVELGAYGVKVEGTFFPLGNISDLGITVAVTEDSSPSTFSLITSDSIKVQAKVSGATNVNMPSVPQISAGLSFDFEKEGGFVFSSEETYSPRLSNLPEIESQVRALREVGSWDTSWHIVVSHVFTPSAQLLIALKRASKVEGSLEGTLTPSISELGKAAVNFSVSENTNNVLVRKLQNVSPIVQLYRLRGSTFIGPGVFGPSRYTAGSGQLPAMDYLLSPDSEVELSAQEFEAVADYLANLN